MYQYNMALNQARETLFDGIHSFGKEVQKSKLLTSQNVGIALIAGIYCGFLYSMYKISQKQTALIQKAVVVAQPVKVEPTKVETQVCSCETADLMNALFVMNMARARMQQQMMLHSFMMSPHFVMYPMMPSPIFRF